MVAAEPSRKKIKTEQTAAAAVAVKDEQLQSDAEGSDDEDDTPMSIIAQFQSEEVSMHCGGAQVVMDWS